MVALQILVLSAQVRILVPQQKNWLARFLQFVGNNCYICEWVCIFYAEIVKKKNRTMAKPIKETPVLYDEDAYRFEMAAQNVVTLPKEEREAIWKAYEEVKSWCAPGVL